VGIQWEGHQPRNIEELGDRTWDIVITVCDHARESCPLILGQPVLVHWGMEDPARVEGDDVTKRRAFREALQLISRRIDQMLALSVDKLDRQALQQQLRAIGEGETSSR
jgi:arsenate reductase